MMIERHHHIDLLVELLDGYPVTAGRTWQKQWTARQ